MKAKNIKKTARKVVEKVIKDPLTKEIIEDEKAIAKKAIEKTAKRIKDKL